MRDFRDAKAMAKAFDCENWNILSVRIDAARPREASAGTGTAGTLHCSFCRKSQHEVLKLIAGPSVFICDACVGLCDAVLESETTLDLFGGRRDAPAGYEEDLAANVERARKHVDEWRGSLERIRRALSARESGAGAPAYPDNRPTADLTELKERHERALARYESTLARVRPGSQNGG